MTPCPECQGRGHLRAHCDERSTEYGCPVCNGSGQLSQCEICGVRAGELVKSEDGRMLCESCCDEGQRLADERSQQQAFEAQITEPWPAIRIPERVTEEVRGLSPETMRECAAAKLRISQDQN